MGLLNRSKLLEKEKLQVEKVDLGDGDFVFVKQMTGRERDRWEQSMVKEKKEGNKIEYERSLEDFRAKLAEVTVCDEKGALILRPGDFATLSENMSAKKLEYIVNTAQKLNNISEEDREALVKNSKGGQTANSTSSSVVS